jgi:hypothetical protein
VLSLVAELRGHERQAAEELEQRKTRVEERKPLDASPAAITPAMICTREQLEEMERWALALHSGRWRWFISIFPENSSRRLALSRHEQETTSGRTS